MKGLMRPMRLIGLMGPIGLIGLSLVGCSTDSTSVDTPTQPTGPEEVAISFGGSRQEEQAVTRAPLTDYGVTTFTVWGFKNTDASPYTAYQQVFPGYRVQWADNSSGTTSTNTSGWEYVGRQIPGDVEQTIKFWDYGAYAYRFMGVTGSEVTGATTTTGEPATTVFQLTFNADSDNPGATPYYSHLWFSEISDPYKIGKPVKLEFLQPFCEVRFMFIFEDPDKAKSTTLTDKSFRPTNGNTIKRSGSVIVSYPLTGTSTTETVTASDDAGGEKALTQDYYESVDKEGGEVVVSPYYKADEDATGKWYTVLPAPQGQGTYTLTVSVNGEVKTTVVPATYMTWQPGYQYTYIFKIHVDGGVEIDSVQSAFDSWEEHAVPRTVYNW